MTEREYEEWLRKQQRRGRGVARVYGGFYLSPGQFGYTTAQEPVNGFGGGTMSTATPGAGGGEGSGGDGGGGAAAGGGGA